MVHFSILLSISIFLSLLYKHKILYIVPYLDQILSNKHSAYKYQIFLQIFLGYCSVSVLVGSRKPLFKNTKVKWTMYVGAIASSEVNFSHWYTWLLSICDWSMSMVNHMVMVRSHMSLSLLILPFFFFRFWDFLTFEISLECGEPDAVH